MIPSRDSSGSAPLSSHLSFAPSLQCHDLPVSQSSSPLSQMESSTGRSLEPLLPIGESGRKKVPDAEFEVSQKAQSERHRSSVRFTAAEFYLPGWLWTLLKQHPRGQNLIILRFFFQDWYEEKPREPRLTLRPPSLAAPYALVQNWHHQPEKLIFESCAYEASVRSDLSPSSMTWSSGSSQTNTSPVLFQYLGSMLIKDLRGTESTQDACAKMRVCGAIS